MLIEAKEVFANIRTGYTSNHPLFNHDFKKELIKFRMWDSFRRKYHEDLPFDTVLFKIRETIGPIWDNLNKQE